MDLSIQTIADVSEEAYRVHVDRHPILTIVTSSDLLLTKWLKEAKKCINNTKQPNTTVVSLTVDTRRRSSSASPTLQPFDLLVFCLGSSCLIYQVPEPYKYNSQHRPIFTPKALKAFLSDPMVMTVGLGIEAVAERLHQVHGIKVANAVDLREIAKRDDLLNGDLNGLARCILGKNIYIQKPKKKVVWCGVGSRYGQLTSEKVMYAVAESHLTFQVAAAALIEANKKKKKKKKKNNAEC